MSIAVKRPGLMTSIQDLGRFGAREVGVPVSGALDTFAMRVANILVGNRENSPVLEMTMSGPALLFEQDSLIALCGGELTAKVNGIPVPYWRPVLVQRGSVLDIGYARSGCRAYLSVAGGFRVPSVMNSCSTFLRGGFGGYEGRALKEGDVLETGTPGSIAQSIQRHLFNGMQEHEREAASASWFVSPELLPAYHYFTVRLVNGPEADRFDRESRERFWSETYRVTPRSDRMGCRLEGTPLHLSAPLEMISEAVAPGTVQVPPNGQPIVLLADCQTTGGYPRIAHVASVDLPVVAQLKPGDTIRFRPVSLEEAQDLLAIREYELRLLAAGVERPGQGSCNSFLAIRDESGIRKRYPPMADFISFLIYWHYEITDCRRCHPHEPPQCHRPQLRYGGKLWRLPYRPG
jgi:antagonist of KipI